MGTMTFNGVSTVDKGLVIQAPPVYDFPAKDRDVIHVEGKNGDVIIDKGSYKNVKRTYLLAVAFGVGVSFVSKASEIVAWLSSSTGYARLEDSYEPNYYRLAQFKDQGQMQNYYDKATALQVSFDCKPQRYLNIGDTPVEIVSKDEYILIQNVTSFVSLPEITIDGIGLTIEFVHGPSSSLPVGTSSLVTSFTGERGVVDSDIQECYSIDIQGNATGYINDKIALTNGFPKLYPGNNYIKITGGTLAKISIKPRWWTL